MLSRATRRFQAPPWPPWGRGPRKEYETDLDTESIQDATVEAMETQQIRILLTPISHARILVAIARVTYDPPKKPLLEPMYDDWCEPDEVASIVDSWVGYAAALSQQIDSSTTDLSPTRRPQRRPR